MASLPASFAAHFEAIVGPQLTERIRVQGTFVGCGLTGYADAHGEVVAHALRMGAAFLPDAAFDLLLDWIDTSLLRQIVRIDQEMAEVAREMRANPTRFFLAVYRPIWAREGRP